MVNDTPGNLNLKRAEKCACFQRPTAGAQVLATAPARALLCSTDDELFRPTNRAKDSRILLILEFPFTCPAAFPSTGNDKLHSQLAEHLWQPRPGRAIAVVLDALWIVA